jgi:hypothetical protein
MKCDSDQSVQLLAFADLVVLPLTQNVDTTAIAAALNAEDGQEAPSFGGCDTPISECQGDLEALSRSLGGRLQTFLTVAR